MSWRVSVEPKVLKVIKKLPGHDRSSISHVIEILTINPYSGDIQKMQGDEIAWRRRVGSYRLFFDIYRNEKIIHVTELRRRTSKTY